jgi:hypothetical protein
MIILAYQTNTRNPFDGPAATNIGTFDITWLNIISNQQNCRQYFGVQNRTQLTAQCLNLCSWAWVQWDSATLIVAPRETLCKTSWFKIRSLWSNKSQHLLNFNDHLPPLSTSHNSLLLLLVCGPCPTLSTAIPLGYPHTPVYRKPVGTKMELVSR